SLLGDDSPAATALAAAALDAVLAQLEPASVLDVGAGIGALAARARRAVPRVVGVEREPALVAAARPACPDIEHVHASAESYLASRPDGAFAVVVATLPDPTLVELVPLLARAARRALVVAGARLWRGPTLRRALERAGCRPLRALAADGWCGYVALR